MFKPSVFRADARRAGPWPDERGTATSSSVRRRVASVGLALVLSATTLTVVPGQADAAFSPCTERHGWIPKGVVAPAIPGVTDPDFTRFADIDGDGDDDRLLLDVIGGVRAWRNDRNGNWAYRGRIALGTGHPPTQVKFADLDGDGKDDYLVIKDNGAIDGWINEGADLTGQNGITAGWRPRGQIARGVGASARLTFFGDLDADGDDDIFAKGGPFGPVSVWRNEGGDTPDRDGWVPLGELIDPDAKSSRFLLTLADANCDHRDDFLWHNVSDINLSKVVVDGNDGIRDGMLKFADVGGHAAGTPDPLEQVFFADLNGDSRFDFLVMAPDGAIVGYENAGGDPK